MRIGVKHELCLYIISYNDLYTLVQFDKDTNLGYDNDFIIVSIIVYVNDDNKFKFSLRNFLKLFLFLFYFNTILFT